MALYEGAEKHFGSAVEMFCNNAGINHVPGWRKCMDIDIVSNEYSYTVLNFKIFRNEKVLSGHSNWRARLAH